MNRPRTLITGFSGMVGSHLADFVLENTDWDIYGMVRWRSPLDNVEHLLGRVNQGDRVFLAYGDLRDPVSLQDVVSKSRPDYMFHLAAQSFPRTSFESPLDTYETNILGTASLLEAVRQSSPKAVIHVCASSEVFGRVSRDKLPINEECTFHPASPYANRHAGVEEIYFVMSGEGEVQINQQSAPIRKDDAVPVRLNEAHSIRNTGPEPLEIMIVGIAVQKGVLDTVARGTDQ